jgi:hypothetical protein
VGKPEGKEPLGIYGYRHEDGINIYIKEIGYEGVNWIYVA